MRPGTRRPSIRPRRRGRRPSLALNCLQLRVAGSVGWIRARSSGARRGQLDAHQSPAIALDPRVAKQPSESVAMSDVPLERHGAPRDQLAVGLGGVERTALHERPVGVGELRRVEPDVPHPLVAVADPHHDRVAVHHPHDVPLLRHVEARSRGFRRGSSNQNQQDARDGRDENDADEPLGAAAAQRRAPRIDSVSWPRSTS